MKQQTTLVFALLAAALFTFNCKSEKKDDSTTNALLLFLADQASGNCATITKSTAGTAYSATGTSVPKGGCNAATLQSGLYTTSPTEAKTAADTGYDGRKALYDAQSSCSALATATTTAKALVTVDTITATQTALTSGNTGCLGVGIGRDVSGALSSVFICKDATSIAAVKALNNYHSVTDVKVDMATSLSSTRTVLTASKATTGFSDAQILALSPLSSSDLTLLSSALNGAAGGAVFTNTTCAQALLSAPLKSFYASIIGINTGYAITQADVTAVTAAKTFNLTCGYGSAFTATATNGTCPSTYPTF
jgi:hypothetical protein